MPGYHRKCGQKEEGRSFLAYPLFLLGKEGEKTMIKAWSRGKKGKGRGSLFCRSSAISPLEEGGRGTL